MAHSKYKAAVLLATIALLLAGCLPVEPPAVEPPEPPVVSPNEPPDPNVEPVEATYWVDAATGDDADPGTAARPWNTLARARIDYSGEPKVVCGDTVAVLPGEYGAFSIAKDYFPLWEGENYDPLSPDEKWVTYIAEGDSIDEAAAALFVDPANRDYRLKAPYVGRGGYERMEDD